MYYKVGESRMLLEMNTVKEYYLNEIKKEWLAASDLFPDFLIEISKETKIQNEQYIQTVTDDFKKQLNRYSRLPMRHKKWKQKTLDILTDILYSETIIGIHDSMDQKTIDAFHEEIQKFLRHVRKFAPELSFEEIGQALRNYIVYAMFKEISQKQCGFNLAGFGYSMLYPFTDNYIDNKNYSAQEKLEYNQIIRDKIQGKEVHPKSMHQRKTCELLQAIEAEYPRDIDTTVFTLLLMMLEAQEDSIRQQNKGLPLTVEESLDISLYKGGISVLIDRFLVKKELTEDELIFYLGLGFFLQLADDLQDIEEDSLQGYQTIFTLDLHPEQEEKIVNKMIHFVYQIMRTYQSENDIFKNFILANCYQLINTSMAGSKKFFSKDYLDKSEKYLPVTYPFLDNFQKNLNANKDLKIQDKYMKLLDGFLN
jgi:hypothetical protein